MKREWYSTIELTGIGGLPSTVQGINKRAKRESWKCRLRQGVQGKAVEYHIDSLPDSTRIMLQMQDNSGSYLVEDKQDPLAVWMATYHQLTTDERDRLIALILRHGIACLIARLDDND